MPTQPLVPDARVVIFTAEACITADLHTGGGRVKDILNLPHALLELKQLTYANPDRPGIPLISYPAGTLRKDEVRCLIVLSEPPQTTVRKIGAYVPKKPVRVSLLIPGMIVVGTLHVQGRYDPTVLLTDAAQETFVPLTHAGVIRAHSTTPAVTPPERLTMFVNRTHLSGILLSEPIEEAAPFPEPIPLRQERPRPAPVVLITHAAAEQPSSSKTGRLSRFAALDVEW
jgi:hypothetical protein